MTITAIIMVSLIVVGVTIQQITEYNDKKGDK